MIGGCCPAGGKHVQYGLIAVKDPTPTGEYCLEIGKPTGLIVKMAGVGVQGVRECTTRVMLLRNGLWTPAIRPGYKKTIRESRKVPKLRFSPTIILYSSFR